MLIGDAERRRNLFAQGRDGRLTHQGRKIRAAKAISAAIACDQVQLYDVVVGISVIGCSQRRRLGQRRQNVQTLIGRGQVDIQQAVETPWTTHGGVDHVGPIRRGNYVGLYARLETIQLGE